MPPARRRTRPRQSIRWDRLGRVALLLVLFGVVLLYVSPAQRWLATYGETKRQQERVRSLQRENVELRARRAAMRSPHQLEIEARRLGFVKPGERSYVIRGLPSG